VCRCDDDVCEVPGEGDRVGGGEFEVRCRGFRGLGDGDGTCGGCGGDGNTGGGGRA